MYKHNLGLYIDCLEMTGKVDDTLLGEIVAYQSSIIRHTYIKYLYINIKRSDSIAGVQKCQFYTSQDLDLVVIIINSNALE